MIHRTRIYALLLLTQYCAAMMTLGAAPSAAPLHGIIRRAQLADNLLRLETEWNRAFEGIVWVGFEQQGALYAAVTQSVSRSNQPVLNFELPANLPAGDVTIRCVPIGQPTAKTATALIKVSPAQASPRPTALAWGVYRDGNLQMHPWNVTSAGLMMWDGQPYIPVGGMINIRSTWQTHAGEPDDTAPAREGAKLLKERLALLKQYGLHDIFFNGFFILSNPNALAELVRISEAEGMRYGLQISSMPAHTSHGFIRDEKNRQTIPEGATSAVIELELTPDEIRPPQRCIWYLLSPKGKLLASGIGPLTQVKQTNAMTLEVAFKKDQAERTLVFLPEVPLPRGDPSGYFAGIDDYIAQVKEIYGSLPLGSGMRLWLDPFSNEMLTPAVISVCTAPQFREGFARWLGHKYDTLAALNQRWASARQEPIDGFATASRLVPMYARADACYWIDPETGAGYVFDAARSEALRDLAEYRGSVCENFISTLADTLKGIADVPVILKHNGWISDWFVNPRRAGGQDGLGYEAYGYGDGLAYHNTLVPYAEALASARRQWTLVTETSPAAFDGQKDYVGYLDRIQLLDDLDQMLKFGAKGVFTFGFSFDPPCNFQVTELIRDVRQLEWLATYAKTVRAAAERLAAYQPDVYGWYPTHVRELEILGEKPRSFEMDGFYTGVATQIRMAPDGNWIVPALRPDAGWRGLLIDGNLLTTGQFDAAKTSPGKEPIWFLGKNRFTQGFPAAWHSAPLNGFTANGVGIIPPNPAGMTLDQFREQVLGYRVFQTEDCNGQTLPDQRLMVWTCVERQPAKLVLPATATAKNPQGQPITPTRDADGHLVLNLMRPPHEKTEKNRPAYLPYGYYYPDHGQPEVAILGGVSVDEVLRLNPPAHLRWLPADVPAANVAVWHEAEDFDETTFTQPRVEGCSRYSEGCGIGINTDFLPPATQTWHARYTIRTPAVDSPQFWLRRMDRPALDIEVRIDGMKAGVVRAKDPVSDLLHLSPWNAGFGGGNLRVGWCRLKIGPLAEGDHTINLIAMPSEMQKQVAIDTKLLGAAPEKETGKRRLQCVQLDAWMITR